MWFGAKQALWPLSKNPPKVARLWIKSDAAWREEILVDLELTKKDPVTLIDSHKHIHWPNTILMCSLGAVHILRQSGETIADEGGMGGKPKADYCWRRGRGGPRTPDFGLCHMWTAPNPSLVPKFCVLYFYLLKEQKLSNYVLPSKCVLFDTIVSWQLL